jgi:CRISPR/Cas system CMR subunit Cmr6 (Cas7 group RAMP superfamily)
MKNITTEELKKMCQDLEAELERREQEEKNKLKAEKDARKKEVDEALEKYKTLLKAYMDDYGIYSYAADENIFDLFSSKFWNLII